MLLNLLHTLMPAMDSRFSETTKAFSEALGYDNEVNKNNKRRLQSFKRIFVCLFFNYCVFLMNQDSPRWKHCILSTERGFDSVLTHLLQIVTAHREVIKEIMTIIVLCWRSLKIFIVQQAEKMIEDLFLVFKSKLHHLSVTEQNYYQLITEKVGWKHKWSLYWCLNVQAVIHFWVL